MGVTVSVLVTYERLVCTCTAWTVCRHFDMDQTPFPNASWMTQVAPEPRWPKWMLPGGSSVPISDWHDRDGYWNQATFSPTPRTVALQHRHRMVRRVASHVNSPKWNQGDGERWVRSVKDECLSKLILIGEPAFRTALSAYIEHFHGERNLARARTISCSFRGTRSPRPAGCDAASAWGACLSSTIRRPHEFFDHTGSHTDPYSGPPTASPCGTRPGNCGACP